MKLIKTYKGHRIWKNGDNFAVELPSGYFMDELAATVKTAMKWIDAATLKYA